MTLDYDCEIETWPFDAYIERSDDRVITFRLICQDANFDETKAVTCHDFEQMAKDIDEEN